MTHLSVIFLSISLFSMLSPNHEETAGHTLSLLYLNAQETQMLLISEPDFLLRRTSYNLREQDFSAKQKVE